MSMIDNTEMQEYATTVEIAIKKIIQASFEQKSDFYFIAMKRLVLPDFLQIYMTDVRIPDAYQMLNFMVSTFSEIGSMPSVSSFVAKFPEHKNIKPLTGLTHEEIEHEVSIVERYLVKGLHAKALLESVRAVRLYGIPETMLSNIRKMYDRENPTVEVEDEDLFENIKRNSEEGVYRLYVNEIDMLTQGITKGYITTIAAYTGGFKTAWAVNIALHNAFEKLHTVYISLEVPKEEICARLTSAYSRIQESPIGSANAIPYQSILHYKHLSETQKSYLKQMQQAYNKNLKPYITICDVNEVSKTDLEEEAFRQMLYKIDDRRPIDILIIDHIGLTKNYTGYAKNGVRVKDEYERINKYVAFFRDMSNSFRTEHGVRRKLSIILLAQINRRGFDGAMKNAEEGGKERVRYSLTAIAEANEIERSSSFVLTIFPNRKDNTAFVQLLKNRNGQPCEDGITTTVDPKFGVFGDAVSIPTDEFEKRIEAMVQKGAEATSSATEETFDLLSDDFDLFEDTDVVY